MVVLFGLAAVVAVLDWRAVFTHNRRAEQYAKPLVMVLLVAVVLTADLDPVVSGAKWWFVAALCLSLLGDLALLPYFDQFEVGLGSFLLAHVAYVIGLIAPNTDTSALLWVGLAVAVVAITIVGRRVADSAGKLQLPVWLYAAAISALVIAAAATGSWLAFAGALLFYASDGLLGWGRFVAPAPGGRTAVHATYHLGQGGLVAWLVLF